MKKELNNGYIKISKPMLSAFNIPIKSKPKRKIKPSLYLGFIKVDIGQEESLYEVLSDYLDKNIFSYIIGKGCIQLLSEDIRKLCSAIIKLRKIQNS